MASRQEVNLTEQVFGVLPPANGGTGATTVAGAGIEQTANKGAANGYAGLGAGALVPAAQLGSGSPSSSTFLRGDQTYAAPPAGALVDPVTVSSAASLTLVTSTTTSVQDYVYNGSAATTWTLPAVSGNTGKRLILENAGSSVSAVITLNRAGSDSIWFLSALTSMTIAQGGSLMLVCDGTYWQVLSTDLAHDAVGLLPVANGGTGQNTLTSLTLTTPVVKGYTETVQAVGTVGASKTLPALSGGTMMTALLTAATTTVFTMPTATAGQSFVLMLQQASTPTGVATFTGVVWPGGTAPTITTTASYFDILTFFCFGSSIWHGTFVQNFAT